MPASMAVQNKSCHNNFLFSDKITKLTGRKTLVVRSHLDFWMTSDTISHYIFKIEVGWHVLSVINIRDMNNLCSCSWKFIRESLLKADNALNAFQANSASDAAPYFYYRQASDRNKV